jgi:hypothetical protein
MKSKNIVVRSGFAALALGIIVAGSLAIADAPKDAKQPEMKLPPGWTAADMQACMIAGTPGKMQEHLAKGAGVWHGKTTMWMGPGTEPMKSECTSTATPIMDGRFLRVEVAGEMPNMGAYSGQGTYGFDNVAQRFVATWIDNHSTGIMSGVGELSSDGKTLTWKYTYSCPLTKQPAVLREVETITGANTKVLESFGNDPKSGKEFQMMRIELTKK